MPNEEGGGIMSSLYFNGIRQEGNYLKIHNHPTFFDALQLLRTQSSKSYQRIPLRKNSILYFYYTEDQIQQSARCKIDLINRSIRMDSEHPGKYSFLSCFLIKERNHVMYLTHKPNLTEKAKVKNQLPCLEESK
ncbi:hypothetical protein ACFYKT_17320 [Cytobacillus sp. FJAT-53684]|uniref:Uncharacterized protein n=1 Tax=Cytobacillus mangrovibacter TaxID=3299024 RepID=A0ABW6K1Q0_9BACI